VALLRARTTSGAASAERRRSAPLLPAQLRARALITRLCRILPPPPSTRTLARARTSCSDLWLVMPLMDKGSCYHCLRMLRKSHRVRDGQGLAEDVIATILRETLLGLDYIHSHGQVRHGRSRGRLRLPSECAPPFTTPRRPSLRRFTATSRPATSCCRVTAAWPLPTLAWPAG